MTIDKLRQIAKAMMPGPGWEWLDVIARNLIARAGPGQDKRDRIVHSRELFDYGLRLVLRSEEELDLSALERAILFRDGLLIAFLACRPLRKRNLRGMLLGQTFVRESDGYWLRFPAATTKTRQPMNIPCLVSLTPLFDKYFVSHRDILLEANSGDPLASRDVWISARGRPMGDMAIYHVVTERTFEEFGKSVNPHLFRDCVATTIAIDDPTFIQIAMVVLGHTTLCMVEKDYNQATSFEAHRALQTVMADERTGRNPAFDVRPAMPIFPRVKRYGRKRTGRWG